MHKNPEVKEKALLQGKDLGLPDQTELIGKQPMLQKFWIQLKYWCLSGIQQYEGEVYVYILS